MRIAGLDHIVLNVEDVERSLGFYQGTLGLGAERVEGWRRGELPFPSVRINENTLIDLVKAPANGQVGRPNVAHFCLVTEADELSGIVDELGRAGVRIEEGPAIRSGARGDALSIYFRDPDHNLIEVRTYARRPMIGTALDQAHARLRSSLEGLEQPEAPLAGYDGWSRKDLIAHLTSIEGRLRQQIECALTGQPMPAEDVDTFNARAVAMRREWSLQQLRDELEQEALASRALLERLQEADLDRTFDHPRRGRMTVADLWLIMPRHLRTHLADLQAATT